MMRVKTTDAKFPPLQTHTMDHPFRTRRDELARASTGIALAADVLAMTRMSAKDHARVLARREPEVEDEAVRTVLARHASRLGLLLEDLQALAPKVTSNDLDAWQRFLRDATPLPDAVVASLEAASAQLRALRDEAARSECDDDVSSTSDYSDSHTESTEEEEDGE